MITLSVPDMNCGHCKSAVESALSPLAAQVAVDLAQRQVRLDGPKNHAAILSALQDIGFSAKIVANSQ